MQQHKWLWWAEGVCSICYQKFFYIEGHEQPKTCGNIECLQKHHFKGMEKFAKV
jgi:hypothetical protein